MRGQHHLVAHTDRLTLLGSRSRRHKGQSTIRRQGQGVPHTCPSGRDTLLGWWNQADSRSPYDTNHHTLVYAAWCCYRSGLLGNRTVAQQRSTCLQHTQPARASFLCDTRYCAGPHHVEVAKGYWHHRLRTSRNTLRAPCAVCVSQLGRTALRCHHTAVAACKSRLPGNRSPDRTSPNTMPTSAQQRRHNAQRGIYAPAACTSQIRLRPTHLQKTRVALTTKSSQLDSNTRGCICLSKTRTLAWIEHHRYPLDTFAGYLRCNSTPVRKVTDHVAPSGLH